ncbi:hypothetical protein [Solibacillus sp. CAU 1738]|uniref:hypothetical protein n=1 Tax=Solibacillus sp. CAU 1738 TaxID=3140363 RepID=UPI00325FF791
MNEKVLSTILVAICSVFAIFFVIKQNFELAVLFLTLMFTFSNFFRYRSFMSQGNIKEAKWMRGLAIFFSIASIAVLYIVLTK